MGVCGVNHSDWFHICKPGFHETPLIVNAILIRDMNLHTWYLLAEPA